jgi:deoxyhypusine synthase
MEKVKDFKWKENMSVFEFFEQFKNLGFQSRELYLASEIITKMKKENAKIFLSFTSNMMTSGLRGFFAQIIKNNLVDVIITTVGGLEEDIMRAKGEDFLITSFYQNDVKLHEDGLNRVGNLLIPNESYERFEDHIHHMINKIYDKNKTPSSCEFFKEIGLQLNDENSVLYQAAKNNVKIFCPGITDGALGFHLYFFRQKHKDFYIDVINDFQELILSTSHDDKKGIICLGGGISKHHTILGTLLNGGADYAVYMTTASSNSGSMSGATTNEAKSWGKIKDDSDAVTIIGDVTITFPLAMSHAIETLSLEEIIKIKK